MTYVIRKDGERYTDVETDRALLAFLSHYIAAMVDGVHVTTDGDLLVRMGHGYTVEVETGPRVVRLPHGGVVNQRDQKR